MPTSSPSSRSVLLAQASLSDFRSELVRRVQDWLASLPDGGKWTRMDFVFASVVALLALTSTGFFTATYKIFSEDPDYFSRRLIASMEGHRVDPVVTGTIVAPPVAGTARAGTVDGAMPVPQIRRAQEPVPGDYEIVMIFGDEALLATRRELLRVKAGSVVPGLGRVIAVDADANAVLSEKATLRIVAP